MYDRTKQIPGNGQRATLATFIQKPPTYFKLFYANDSLGYDPIKIFSV